MGHLSPAARRTEAYTADGAERDMYLDIGHFVTAFGFVDLCLSSILAVATRSLNLDMFDILARGMDARVKLERIRKVAKKQKGIGPDLEARLRIFETTMIGTRNDIAHSAFYSSNDADELRYFRVRLADMPLHKFEADSKPSKLVPTIKSLELFQYGEWLWQFGTDLRSVLHAAKRGDILELDQPKSPLRGAFPEHPSRTGKRAKSGKPARKRLGPA
jgi:hypothetical protein